MYLDINHIESPSNGVRELQARAPNFRFHVHPVARMKSDAGVFIKELRHFGANNYNAFATVTSLSIHTTSRYLPFGHCAF
jgi:hypothetical protein